MILIYELCHLSHKQHWNTIIILLFFAELFCDPPLMIENAEHNLNTSNDLQWPINQTVMYSCKGESVHYNGSLEGSCSVNTTWDFTEGEPRCYGEYK